MNQLRALLIDASEYDTSRLLAEWHWVIPEFATPLFISAFGDWVFGHRDGSLWMLSLLDADYRLVAENSAEYNTLNKSAEWIEKTFLGAWQVIAARHGMQPGKDECLGWKVHPLIGGKFEVANLQIFSMLVYQSLMGQLHRHMQESPAQRPSSRLAPSSGTGNHCHSGPLLTLPRSNTTNVQFRYEPRWRSRAIRKLAGGAKPGFASTRFPATVD